MNPLVRPAIAIVFLAQVACASELGIRHQDPVTSSLTIAVDDGEPESMSHGDRIDVALESGQHRVVVDRTFADGRTMRSVLLISFDPRRETVVTLVPLEEPIP